MKVKELIEQLNEYPENADIYISTGTDIYDYNAEQMEVSEVDALEYDGIEISTVLIVPDDELVVKRTLQDNLKCIRSLFGEED